MSSDDNEKNPWSKKKTTPKKENNPEKNVNSEDKANDFVTQIRDKIQQQTRNTFKNSENNFHNISFFNKKKENGNKSHSSNHQGGDDFLPPINKTTLLGFLIALVGLWFLSGFYVVQEGSASIVLRFGKENRTTNAGLSYRLPWPIETNIVKKVEVVNQINSSGSDQQGDEKTIVLTGDENMLHVNYSVFWKIKNLSQFLFNNRDQEKTIRAASESAIREVLGQTTARSALTTDREQIGPDARIALQILLDEYQLGVEITNFQLQMVEPPTQVIDAFNDMQASLIDANRMENEAQAYANSIIPKARGEAVTIVQQARAHAETVLGKARGEALQFTAIYEAYKDKKEVTLKRLYLEGMQKILSNVKNKTIIDDNIAHQTLPHLSLNQNNVLKP